MKSEYYGKRGIRTQWDIDKLRAVDSSSSILRHNLLHHPEEDPLTNTMVCHPEEFHIRPMDRIIAETLKIKNALADKEVILMNAKTEFSRCVLPGITPTPTEQEKEFDKKIRKDIRRLKTTLKAKGQHKTLTYHHLSKQQETGLALQCKGSSQEVPQVPQAT